MEEEINNLIDILADEVGDKRAINQVLNIIGARLAKQGLFMGSAMGIAEEEVANGWQEYKCRGEVNEEV